jgi:hypothetical protein
MKMSREADDFPRQDLPYTFEKLKRRGILARLFFGAGLRKLENDYLNPKHGDVLASQRRYRRYLAGDKSVVRQASLAVWVPLISAAAGPTLIALMAVALWVKDEIKHHTPVPATDVVSPSTSSQGAQAAMPPVVPATSPDSPAGNPARADATASQQEPPASDASVELQQADTQAQPAQPAADTNAGENTDAQQSDTARDLAMKSQALLARAEQQFDTGQYASAAATAEAVLEIDPGNISAQRIRDASRQYPVTGQAADSTAAPAIVPPPSAQAVPASPFPAQVPSPPAGTCVYGCGRPSHGLHVTIR